VEPPDASINPEASGEATSTRIADGPFPRDECDAAFTRVRQLERAAGRLEAALATYAGYTEAARRAMLQDLGPDARGLEPWESLDVLRHVLRGGWCEDVEVPEPLRLPGQIPDGTTQGQNGLNLGY
jgi:hypothetical protein